MIATAPAGGWSTALGVDPATPLDQALITRILNIAEAAIRRDPSMSPGIYNPIVEQTIRDWRASTENALRKLIGSAVGSVPNDLSTIAPQGNPLGAGTWAGDVVSGVAAGIGDAVSHGALLAAILVAILLGAWMVLRPSGGGTIDVAQLRRALA